MAVKNIAVTDTLETFRTTFNDMALNDMGDIALLSGAISSTNLVAAMNETISIATSTAGFRIEDASSSQQLIGGGDILRVLGSANEIDAVVSATDTLTIGLPNDVTIANDLTVTNSIGVGTITISSNDITDSTGTIQFANDNLETTGTITGAGFTATGGTSIFGTVQIAGNTINSTDSSTLIIDDSVSFTTGKTLTVDKISSTQSYIDFGAINISTDGHFYTATTGNGGFIFEGATPDSSETKVYAIDPTADRIIALPDESGTVLTTGSTDTITETMMANDAIGSAELKNVQTLVIYNSAGVAVKTIYGAGS